MTTEEVAPPAIVESRILVIRGQKVLLDADLAALYQVETKTLNRAVKRHRNRFPGDFMFQLTMEEDESLVPQTNDGAVDAILPMPSLNRA
jgi:hypothetical protein